MKTICIIAIWLTFFFVFNYAGKEIRLASQHNKFINTFVMSTDCITFQQSGGGPVGYDNYYKWIYAKWRADPKRTTFEKIMFWRIGIFYDASNPPEAYQYPFLL